MQPYRGRHRERTHLGQSNLSCSSLMHRRCAKKQQRNDLPATQMELPVRGGATGFVRLSFHSRKLLGTFLYWLQKPGFSSFLDPPLTALGFSKMLLRSRLCSPLNRGRVGVEAVSERSISNHGSPGNCNKSMYLQASQCLELSRDSKAKQKTVP